ncbi:HIPL1 protein-like [Miscanthus floridulus]|uniref:HIPL1 protein-like n=1 Tax=Miscanthus floridulus TaxID=154761 RepID=UPI0034577079
MVSGSSCCHAEENAVLKQEFEAMSIADASCAAIVKHILCARNASRLLPGRSLRSMQRDQRLSLSGAPPRIRPALLDISAALFLVPHSKNLRASRESPQAPTAEWPHIQMASRIFLSTLEGEIWLASVPARGSGSALQINGSPFLDLTDRVLQLVGITFHLEFATNGRFFVSCTCDCSTMPSCAGSCSSAAGNCSTPPSQYQLIVSEFSAMSGDDYSKETRADPAQVRRVFSMALPLQHRTSYDQDVGQILFWPIDNDDYYYYLYLVAGHSGEGDLCKKNTSNCGKIIKLNVDNSTTRKIEIFAVGLSNPMGCSFDSAWPSNFCCANVDQVYMHTLLDSGALPSA